ncbi:MAG: hypothetical protein U0599_20915 [Vicinamibacteria bacterium]
MTGHASEPAATRSDTRGRDRGPGVRAAAWRRLLRRPETALFVAALVSYAYFYQAGGWNQNSRFDLVRAIVERGTASIDAYHENTNDKARIGDSFYCDKAPGVSWMAVPAYAFARLVLPRPDGDDVAEARFLAFAAYVSTVWAIGVPSAVSVVALALLLGAIGVGERTRLAAAAAYGLGTLALPTRRCSTATRSPLPSPSARSRSSSAPATPAAPVRSSSRARGRCWAAPW